MAKDRSPGSSHVYRYQSSIKQRLNELSTAGQAVASHLGAHPEQIPFETAHSLAKRVGVSAMSVGRTLKTLGYQGLAELRAEMRSEVEEAPAPWGRKVPPSAPPRLKRLDRTRALRAELEAVEGVHALAETAPWQAAVKLIAAANQVFVAGFQTERGLAITFADQLAYVRPRVRWLSVDNRAFADLRTEAGADSCLVLVDGRRYSRSFRLLGQKASELGVPLVIATDAYCGWARELTPHALQARTDSGRFWDNNAPISSLLNLLVEDVIEHLGEAVRPQLDAATEFGAAFVGFERARRPRRGR
jgi:DNA-binding MurR/RpiR family transcriptional regulator